MAKTLLKIPTLANSRHFPRLIWGFAILLIIAILVIPRIDRSLQEDSPRADATPDPFAEEVVEMEEKLQGGTLSEVDEEEALAAATLLKARSLTEAGPMTPTEIIFAVDHFDDFRPQIAAQPDTPSKETLRRHRNALLFEELPRLDEERGAQALDEIRRAYLEAFEIDPAQ